VTSALQDNFIAFFLPRCEAELQINLEAFSAWPEKNYEKK